MKHSKFIGLAAVAIAALMAIGAGPASATTLEIGGATQTKDVSIVATLAAGTSAVLKDNLGVQTDTCTTSEVKGEDNEITTGTAVSGVITGLTFENCTDTTAVLTKGKLKIERIANTTNGTVTSLNAEVTVFATALNASAVCRTGTGTDIGVLTGVSSGKAVMHVSTNKLNCGILGTATWTAEYLVTSPEGLGVVS